MRVREVVSVAPGELMIARSKPASLPVEAYENGQDPSDKCSTQKVSRSD